MMRLVRRLAADRAGSSAAEMAMVTPLLLVLMFGAFELGYYFMSEHVVQKSVRDAARYAARLPLTESDGTKNYDCSNSAVDAAAKTKIQRVAKAGDPDGDWDDDGTQDQRLAGWTADSMTTVTLLPCDTSGYYRGVFTDFPGGVPVIRVSATVPYPSLFGTIGLGNPSLTLNAASEAAVFGA